MYISRNIKVPTGNICIAEGEKGLLEFLSIGDYGKDKNVKADFMGLSREINGVPNCGIMPLYKKWVITISSQYGCSMGCSFCDVPKVGPGKNATTQDMLDQIRTAMSLHTIDRYIERLNIHFARMGEPTWNTDVISAAKLIRYETPGTTAHIHPVVSTMMPKNNKHLTRFIFEWLHYVKNNLYNGEAGLQLSINTTDEHVRSIHMPHALTLREISGVMADTVPYLEGGLKGRKIALNFALTDASIDAEYLATLFSPKYFMCKITPMHLTNSCTDNNIITRDGYSNYYPYARVESNLKKVGFDVIVFIPSLDEDMSRITCGNAILSGSKVEI